MSDLTLWQIEAELAELFNAREQLVELGEDLAPIDLAIRGYVEREIRKVDSIRGALKYAEMIVTAAREEADLQKQRAKVAQGRIDRLKDICRFVMEAMPWEAGRMRRLEGRTGSILLKTNGGALAVAITKPDLIPEELVQYTGTISGAAWKWLSDYLDGQSHKWGWMERQDVQMERIPHKGRIAAALEKKCPTCLGEGEVCITDAGRSLCPGCDGDGKARVPGAHFETRGWHIEVK